MLNELNDDIVETEMNASEAREISQLYAKRLSGTEIHSVDCMIKKSAETGRKKLVLKKRLAFDTMLSLRRRGFFVAYQAPFTTEETLTTINWDNPVHSSKIKEEITADEAFAIDRSPHAPAEIGELISMVITATYKGEFWFNWYYEISEEAEKNLNELGYSVVNYRSGIFVKNTIEW